MMIVAFLAMGFFVFMPRGKDYLRVVSALRDSEMKLQRRANAMETVSRVSAAAATTLDPDQLLQNVVDLAKSSFKLYHAHIYLLDEQNEQLVLAAGAGDAGRQMKANGHYIPFDHPRSLVSRAAHNRRVTISNDVTNEPDFLSNPLLPETRSEMSVPMIIGNTLVGVLDMQSEEKDHFSAEDARIHAALAEQIAVAVENARVHGQVQTARRAEQSALQDSERRADELKLVADVSAAASAILDIETLLPSVADLTNSTFDLYHTHIYLLDERFEYLVLAAGAGEAGRIMKTQGHRIALRNQGSLVARAGRSRRTVVVNDVHQAVDWMPNPLLPDTQSEMALPMVVGNALIGVLDVQSDKLDFFTDSTVMVQTALADQIAIAIQNARLFQETRLTQTVIENNNDSVIITDIDEKTIYVNPRFSELFGYAPQEMIGQSPRVLHGPMTQRDRLDAIREAIEHQHPIQQELINYRKDGTPFWIELSISPVIDNKGRLTHYIGIQQDITDRKTLEMHRDQMLRQAEEQANMERATADRLREIDRLKSDFLASMSHELRTPLNSIIGYSEVMLDGIDGELPESAVEDVQAIYDSGQHLLSLINDILDLAKIEAGRMELDLEPTPLDTVMDEVQRLSRILLKQKPVTLTVDIADDFPWLYVDRVRLRQILNNLVSNAIKFTERGEVLITAEAQQDRGMAHLSVRDSGIGIDKQHLQVIFEQFRQIDSGSTRRAGGTGLGLPITKRLVEMQGGKIWVESVVGVGSTFHFTIPLASSKEAVARRQIEEL
ncbi:MAG: GAF domain-containing protein [Anaerolineae bacterium]